MPSVAFTASGFKVSQKIAKVQRNVWFHFIVVPARNIGFFHVTTLSMHVGNCDFLTTACKGDAQLVKFFPFMLLAHVFVAVGFVWVYLMGREDKPFLAQGVRYGVAIAVLTTVPTYLIY